MAELSSDQKARAFRNQDRANYAVSASVPAAAGAIFIPVVGPFVALGIAGPHLMKLIGPIHSQIVSLQLLCLLGLVLPISVAPNGMFALYRSSTKGPLSIEPLLHSLASRDSLSLILLLGIGQGRSSCQQALETALT